MRKLPIDDTRTIREQSILDFTGTLKIAMSRMLKEIGVEPEFKLRIDASRLSCKRPLTRVEVKFQRMEEDRHFYVHTVLADADVESFEI